MAYHFSKEELLRFANIFDNAGQVFLAGLVIGPLFSIEVDVLLPLIVVLGLICAFVCWFLSWWFTKEANKWQ